MRAKEDNTYHMTGATSNSHKEEQDNNEDERATNRVDSLHPLRNIQGQSREDI